MPLCVWITVYFSWVSFCAIMRPLWNSHPQGILGIVVPLPMDALAICEK